MSTEEEILDLEFETHNAMGRVAMFAGVPVFPLLFLIMGFAVTLFASIYLWGWWGLLPPVPFVLAVIGLRLICERDDKAMRRFWFQRLRSRLNHKYGRHLLITPRNPQWSIKHARRIIKKRILTGE